jgi:hypothetical protein
MTPTTTLPSSTTTRGCFAIIIILYNNIILIVVQIQEVGENGYHAVVEGSCRMIMTMMMVSPTKTINRDNISKGFKNQKK